MFELETYPPYKNIPNLALRNKRPNTAGSPHNYFHSNFYKLWRIQPKTKREKDNLIPAPLISSFKSLKSVFVYTPFEHGPSLFLPWRHMFTKPSEYYVFAAVAQRASGSSQAHINVNNGQRIRSILKLFNLCKSQRFHLSVARSCPQADDNIWGVPATTQTRCGSQISGVVKRKW